MRESNIGRKRASSASADKRMTGHGVTESGSACPRIPPARISEAAGAYCLVALALRVLEIQTACGDFPIRHHLCRHDARFHQLLVLGRRTVAGTWCAGTVLSLSFGVRALFFLVNVTTAHLRQIAAMIDAGDLAVNVGTVMPL